MKKRYKIGDLVRVKIGDPYYNSIGIITKIYKQWDGNRNGFGIHILKDPRIEFILYRGKVADEFERI